MAEKCKTEQGRLEGYKMENGAMAKIKRALINLSEETGIDELAEVLNEFGVEILSTDEAISGSEYLERAASSKRCTEDFPKTLNLKFEKVRDLLVGENHHQKAAFYKDPAVKDSWICGAKQLQGRKLSFNGMIDINATIEILRHFERPAVSFMKHTTPCGVATSDSLSKAFIDALECDRLSLFGSTMGINRKVDNKLAELIMEETDSIYIEAIIAPYFDNNTSEIFSKKKHLNLFEIPNLKKISAKEMDYIKVAGGGLLAQEADSKIVTEKDLKVVTKKAPSKEDIVSLLFGEKVAKRAKSNAIVLCKGTKTVGIGAGQTSREEAASLAFRKAGNRAKGATLASDARFSRRDVIDYAHKAGIKAVIQQGGSKIDQGIVNACINHAHKRGIKNAIQYGGAEVDRETISACNKYGISMVFTGYRHFLH